MRIYGTSGCMQTLHEDLECLNYDHKFKRPFDKLMHMQILRNVEEKSFYAIFMKMSVYGTNRYGMEILQD